jgi:hypothetical protein
MFSWDEMRAMGSGEKVAWCAFALLFLCAGYVLLSSGNAGDKEIGLVGAHMMLHGRMLYQDIVPVSPPLIYYLYLIPAYFSERIGGFRDFQAFNGIGIMAIFWSGLGVCDAGGVHDRAYGVQGTYGFAGPVGKIPAFQRSMGALPPRSRYLP